MRLLLVMWLTLGLAPGVGEIAESAIHLATVGHLAHSDADQGDLGDQGAEHGCGTTQHRCGCCASQSAAASTPLAVVAGSAQALAQAPDSRTLASLHEPAPPYRPPIAW